MTWRLDSALNNLAADVEATAPQAATRQGSTSPENAEIDPWIYLEGSNGLPIRTIAMAITAMRRVLVPGDPKDVLVLTILHNARTPNEYTLAAEAFRNWAKEEKLLRDPPGQPTPM